MTTKALGTWQPLLDGDLQARALAVADEIAAELKSRGADMTSDGSLASGHAGLAVAFAYFDQALPGRGYGDAAGVHLNAATDYLAEYPLNADLYGGFTGIAWAAAQVERLAGRSSAAGDEFGEIDDLLLDMLSAPAWEGHYDLISGLVGVGVYALERLPHPKAHECLTRVVQHLDRWSEVRPDGATWHTPLHLLPPHRRQVRPNGEDNLGLAHGAPGPIALLAQASAAGAAGDVAARLVDQAVPWLMAQRMNYSPSASFGYEVFPEDDQGPSRSAWCYGDCGIAAALLNAARSRGNAEWERTAVELAVAAGNRPDAEMGVADAGMCHGWAGLAHIFNRLYQTSGDARLAEPARRYVERTLAMQHPGRGIAGYAAWASHGDQPWDWASEVGLLEGAAGVAMALAAAATDVAPTWDSVMLISNTVVS
jgi:lantibiotic biosynthesis protein